MARPYRPRVYWRLKVNGKWTWRPVETFGREEADPMSQGDCWILIKQYQGESA